MSAAPSVPAPSSAPALSHALDRATLGLALIAVAYHFLTVWAVPHGATRHYTVHLGLVMTIAILSAASAALVGRARVPRLKLASLALALTAVVPCTIYLYVEDGRLETTQPWLTTTDMVVAGVLVAVVLVVTYFVWGWDFTLWCAVCIPYFFWGQYLPGVLWHVEMTPTVVLSYLAGMGAPRGVFWGIPLSAETIFLLLVYGGALQGCRVIEMFIEVGRAAGNLMRGGIAYSAIVASSLIAMVTGEAISNVALAGTMTIPAMKSRGFTPEQAAAIEATASSGSQITPPIMSVAAFLMAVILNVSYVEILQRAVIPALLYFIGISFGVYAIILSSPRIRYSREIVDVRFILWVFPSFIISITVLMVLLFQRYSAGYAACWATLSLWALSFLRTREFRPGLPMMIRGLGRGAVVASQLAVALTAIGIMVQTFLTTGLGIALGRLMTDLSRGQLWLALLIGSVLAILIGTALPTPPAYVLCAVVVVPALINLGALPMAAHFFALYWAAFSTLTPPVAMAVMAAARIAGARHNAAAWEAMKLNVVVFFLPFTYVYAPDILAFPRITLATLEITGIVLLAGLTTSAALYGQLWFPLTRAERWLLAVGPVSLFANLATGHAWFLIPPLAVLAGVITRHKLRPRPLAITASERASQPE